MYLTPRYKTMKDETARKELMLKLHKRKTDLFMEAVESGSMPLRPGVKRLVQEAIANGVKVAVCSTSNERAVTSIVKRLLGPEIFARMPVFAGDAVRRKKPSPDIYLLAARELGVAPARCVVIEDSEIGLAAGRAAGMRVIVTKSRYTDDESFEGADAVFDCIGEEGEERFSLDDLTTPGALEQRKKEMEMKAV
jgi:HAD superfamily hydrolase (TIGR01509 family)